jgi:hypothetical protein
MCLSTREELADLRELHRTTSTSLPRDVHPSSHPYSMPSAAVDTSGAFTPCRGTPSPPHGGTGGPAGAPSPGGTAAPNIPPVFRDTGLHYNQEGIGSASLSGMPYGLSSSMQLRHLSSHTRGDDRVTFPAMRGAPILLLYQLALPLLRVAVLCSYTGSLIALLFPN